MTSFISDDLDFDSEIMDAMFARMQAEAAELKLSNAQQQALPEAQRILETQAQMIFSPEAMNFIMISSSTALGASNNPEAFASMFKYIISEALRTANNEWRFDAKELNQLMDIRNHQFILDLYEGLKSPVEN